MAANKKKSKPPKKGSARKIEPKKKAAAKLVQKKKPLTKTIAKPAAKKPVRASAPLKKKAKAAATRVLAASKAAEKLPARAAPASPKANTGKIVSTPKANLRSATTSAVDEPRNRPAPYQAARDEEYMNNKQVQHFRQMLLSWRHDLMEEVDRTVHHMQDDAANFPDPNDRATQEEEFALELRTRDRERKLIKKINESLAALDAGTYGYCETCGVEIGVKRLEARPTATLCIDCKTLDEIREKQRA
jgi:DnaK suppressor protein